MTELTGPEAARLVALHAVAQSQAQRMKDAAEEFQVAHKRWAEAISALMQYADDKLAEYASAEKVVKLRPSITLPGEQRP